MDADSAVNAAGNAARVAVRVAAKEVAAVKDVGIAIATRAMDVIVISIRVIIDAVNAVATAVWQEVGQIQVYNCHRAVEVVK